VSKTLENDIKQIFELIKQTTSTSVVKEFLKKQNLPFSASSWKELFEKRINPAFDDKQLSIESLVDLLRECEEVGRQHVFLFECNVSKISDILNESKLKKKLNSLKLSQLLDKPIVVDLPIEATIVDIRLEDEGLVIKLIEAKETLVPAGDKESKDGKYVTKKYERIMERAVNVFKLHKDGLLEIRVASKSTGSKGYKVEVERLGSYISEIIPINSFRPVSLSVAKDKIWENRSQLTDVIRYSDATLKDDYGFSLKAASNSKEADLSDNAKVVSSMDSFLGNDTFCESNNIFFRPQKGGVPTKEIHVLISGELNEFAITANCEKTDYNYVLNQLRKLNTRIS